MTSLKQHILIILLFQVSNPVGPPCRLTSLTSIQTLAKKSWMRTALPTLLVFLPLTKGMVTLRDSCTAMSGMYSKVADGLVPGARVLIKQNTNPKKI